MSRDPIGDLMVLAQERHFATTKTTGAYWAMNRTMLRWLRRKSLYVRNIFPAKPARTRAVHRAYRKLGRVPR